MHLFIHLSPFRDYRMDTNKLSRIKLKEIEEGRWHLHDVSWPICSIWFVGSQRTGKYNMAMESRCVWNSKPGFDSAQCGDQQGFT